MSSFFTAAGMAYSRSWIVIISEKWVETRIGVTYIYMYKELGLPYWHHHLVLNWYLYKPDTSVKSHKAMSTNEWHLDPYIGPQVYRGLMIGILKCQKKMVSLCVGQKRFLYEMAQWRETRQWGKCRVGSSGVNIEDKSLEKSTRAEWELTVEKSRRWSKQWREVH